MKERLVVCASVFTLVVAIGLSPAVRAQQATRGAAGDEKSSAQMHETIHGIIAGITAEGEVFFDHQTNTAVKAEAAFLTVVGSPVHPGAAAGGEHHAATTATAGQHAQTGEHRHNVYIVWLTPKTKVCEMTYQAGAAGTAAHAKSEHAKKEVALDELEVGDRVEVAFTPHEESASHANVHQTEHMRNKHGRHRTHVGNATAITILLPAEHAQSGAAGGERSSAKARSSC